MTEFNVYGIAVRFDDDAEASFEEAKQYYQHAMGRFLANGGGSRVLKRIIIRRDGEWADMEYVVETPPFERIRRITGYLTGTLDRWNAAKRHEYNDRVKHGGKTDE